MDVTEVPFNQFLGIRKAEDAGWLLELQGRPEFANHLGGVHAVAQLALAEAASAQFLAARFGDLAPQAVPVVRRLEAKFRRPAAGGLRARARADEQALRKFEEDFRDRGRARVGVEVEVLDGEGAATLSCTVEWFVQRRG
jgi:acyl-coenzyme A thioesterase PaaI-like protein